MIEGAITQVTAHTTRFRAEGLQALDFMRTSHATPQTGRVCLVVRPHQILLRVGDEQVDGACVWLDGCVMSAEFSGWFCRYKVQVGGIFLVADQPHHLGLAMFAPGFRVRIGLDPMQIRFLES